MSTGKFIAAVLLAGLLSRLPAAPDCRPCHDQPPPLPLGKTMGLNEIAVGVLDKGQLQVNTGNFGLLADFHYWFTNAAHWPRSAGYDRQYAFGLGLLVGIDPGNVIETVTQGGAIEDWLPLDDAAGHEYSGEVTAVSDETPFLASSDLSKTWPLGHYDEAGQWVASGKRDWPGPFRIDVGHPGYPDTLVEAEGEFTSDRDIYCVYNDAQNALAPGGVGIEVEQSSYSYGRPYAEDMVFWQFTIRNTSGSDLEGIYVGLLAKFRPDYDNHDYINLIDSDYDGSQDLVYVYDVNNQRNRTWADADDPLGMVGIRVFDTPYDLGITDFHHFPHEKRIETDSLAWAIMTSDKDSPALYDTTGDFSSLFFHGDDPRIDYTGEDSLEAFYPPWKEEDSGEIFGGQAVDYIISCGPFNLPAGASVPFSLALIMGDAGETPFAPDTSDLMLNVRTASAMYNLQYQGSGPPAPPEVFALAGDRSATLYWTAEPSESSRDALTGEMDFEGYKIFRSTSQGLTWGRGVTDEFGAPAGYEQIATFDLINDVSGLDPVFPQHLGRNSGLAYTYLDDNLINGLEYWYCVTAYDRGNQNPDTLEQSYLYPLGASVLEPHTVSVIPGVKAVDLPSDDNLAPIGGDCGGSVRVVIIDTAAVTGHGYRITFEDEVITSIDSSDTTWGLVFNLVDITETDTILYQQAVPGEPGEYAPPVDGFRLVMENVEPGVAFMGWTKVAGDTCTFDWWAGPRTGNASEIPDDLYGFEDFKIVITDTTDMATVTFTNYFAMFDTSGTTIDIPLRVYKITDPETPVDVTEYAMILDWTTMSGHTPEFYGPYGWDLIPGGPGFDPAFYYGALKFGVDLLFLADSQGGEASMVFLKTQNGPADETPPSVGDEFTILSGKPFRPEISYEFGTGAAQIASVPQAELSNPLADVRVVPDPYVVTNIWESSEFGKKLQFNHLPSRCTIKIFTLVGEHVATVEHPAAGSEGSGFAFWNMRNKHDQFIAPGVYLYAVTTDDGHKKLGRFLVIK